MRTLLLLIFGVGGLALLLSLGAWQVQRLNWKTAILDDIEARIAAEPELLPADPDPEVDRYLPVSVTGEVTGEPLHVLFSTQALGAAYRLIAPFRTVDGRSILIDLGAIPADAKDASRVFPPLTITGNLHWPEETDSFTPEPERERNIWFARDVALMASELDAEPVLVVARSVEPALAGVMQVPVGITNIPNDHLGYAITWFSLAAIWAGMTVVLGWRIAGAKRREG